MSKLRSQLNNLSADMNHVSHKSPGNHGQQPDTRNQSHVEENYQKLAEIKSAIEHLTGKLNAAAAAQQQHASATQQQHELPQAPQPTQTAPGLEIDTRQLAQSVARDVGNDLRENISGEIDRILMELNQLQINAGESSNRAVLNDIQQISEGIQELQTYQANNQEQFNELSGGLRGIHQDVRALSQHQSDNSEYDRITETIQLAYNEIANKLDGLGNSGASEHIVALSEKLENIKDGIASTDPHTLQRIEQQLHDLGERVSILASEPLSDDGESLNAMLPEYFEGFDRRLDEITRAVMASAASDNNQESDAFERIEARINSLAKSFDNISIDTQHLAENPQMPEQLQKTLARLEAYIEQKPIETTATESQEDQEFANQLATLNDKIDQIYSDSANREQVPQPNSELLDKLDTLSLTLERAINSGDGSVEQLEKQIVQLSQRIDEAVNSEQEEQQVREQQEAAIAAQLAAIAAKVDSLEPEQSDSYNYQEQLSALEGQISAISSQLSSINELPDFNSIEQRLGGIEEQFISSRDAAIEAATQAIQQAGTLGGNDEQSQLISSLADDLKNLSASTHELRGHSLETFDAVRESLSMILDRINSIEVRIANEDSSQGFNYPDETPDQYHHNADMVNAAREYASSLTKKAQWAEDNEQSRLATLAEDAHMQQHQAEGEQLPEVDAPALNMEQLPEMDEAMQPEMAEMQQSDEVRQAVEEPVDVPLEPGSGAPRVNPNSPDMNELFRQAKENNRGQVLEDEQQNPTDFIAAARRAAQAAASEAESIAEVDEEQPEKSGFSLSKLLARKKKVVMLSAAAIILALLAAPAYNYLKKNGSGLLTRFQPTAIEQSVDQAQQPPQQINNKEQAAKENHSKVNQAEENNIPKLAADNVQKNNAAEIEQHRQLDVTPVVTEQADAVNNPDQNETKQIKTVEQADVVAPVVAPVAVQDIRSDIVPETQVAKVIPTPPNEVGPIVLRQAAANGDPKALFEIGRRYTQGVGGEPDFVEAAKWYQLAADKNLAPAQYRLGNFNEKGHGIKRDVDKAAYWYERAAKQGNALAMHNLAVVNAMGVLKGGTDMKSATTWFEQAAEYGVKDSQVNLGVIYATAMGVEVDLAKAYKWFAIAAKAGDKDAAEKRDTIAKRLKADQLKTARGEVELWRPKEMDKAINSVEIPVEWEVTPELTASLSNMEMIHQVQSLLNKHGFKAGKADGLMGSKTVKAIKDFQAQAGLPITGKVSDELLKALQKS